MTRRPLQTNGMSLFVISLFSCGGGGDGGWGRKVFLVLFFHIPAWVCGKRRPTVIHDESLSIVLNNMNGYSVFGILIFSGGVGWRAVRFLRTPAQNRYFSRPKKQ